MDVFRSKRIADIRVWNAAKERVLENQKSGLADSLFSLPENEWRAIRWRTDKEITGNDTAGYFVVSSIYLDITDPLDTENYLHEKLNKAYFRLSKVEALCCDIWKLYNTDMSVCEAMKAEDEILERMDLLGLLGAEK